MKRILLFFLMLCTYIGVQAAITGYTSQKTINGTTIDIVGLSSWDNPGDVAKVLNSTTTISGVTLEQIKAAKYVKIGGTDTEVLNEDDIAALAQLESVVYLDMDRCRLADGVDMSKFGVSSTALEYVVLPTGTTTEQLKAANDKIKAVATNAKATVAITGTSVQQDVLSYSYTLNGTDYEYTGDVPANLTVTLTDEPVMATLTLVSGYPKYQYTNSQNGDKVYEITADDLTGHTSKEWKNIDGVNKEWDFYVPAQVDTRLTKTQEEKFYYAKEGIEYEFGWNLRNDNGNNYLSYNAETSTYTLSQNAWNSALNETVNSGETVIVKTVDKYTYTLPNSSDAKEYTGTVTEDGDNYVGTVANENSACKFIYTPVYKYTYTDKDGNEQTVTYDAEDADGKIQITTYSGEVTLHEVKTPHTVTTVDAATIFINTGGSLADTFDSSIGLYSSQALNNYSNAPKVIILGTPNADDLTALNSFSYDTKLIDLSGATLSADVDVSVLRASDVRAKNQKRAFILPESDNVQKQIGTLLNGYVDGLSAIGYFTTSERNEVTTKTLNMFAYDTLVENFAPAVDNTMAIYGLPVYNTDGSFNTYTSPHTNFFASLGKLPVASIDLTWYNASEVRDLSALNAETHYIVVPQNASNDTEAIDFTNEGAGKSYTYNDNIWVVATYKGLTSPYATGASYGRGKDGTGTGVFYQTTTTNETTNVTYIRTAGKLNGATPFISTDLLDAQRMIIVGEVNSDDLTAMGNVQAQTVDLTHATIADGSAITTYSSKSVKYLALPYEMSTADTKNLAEAIHATSDNQLKGVASYVTSNKEITYVSYEEGAGINTIPMLGKSTSATTESLVAIGKLNARDIFASGNSVKIGNDGHLAFDAEANEEYSQTRATTGDITTGALDGLGSLKKVDLSDAEFSKVEDMTLSSLNIVGSSTKIVKIPTSATELPADFLNVDGCPIVSICIPRNIEKIGPRAFQKLNLRHVWTTGTADEETNTKLDNGAVYHADDFSGTKTMDTLEKDGEKPALATGDDAATKDLWYGTFTFSSNLKEIDSYAFGGSVCVKDVYVLNPVAPACHVDAFSTISYVANNTIDKSKVNPETGGVCRDSYYNGMPQWMTMLHFPTTATDDNVKRFTDPTREFTIVSGETDDSGNPIKLPRQTEMNRAFTQGTTGYLWNAWDESRQPDKGGNALEYSLTAWDEDIYNADWEKTGTINHPASYDQYVTSQSQATYQTNGNTLYTASTNTKKTSSVFYDTDVTTTTESESLTYNTTLYDKDYRGWHQFVLTGYAANTIKEHNYFSFEKYSGDDWWTICLPFDMTKKELGTYFGAATITRDADNQVTDVTITKYPMLCKLIGVERDDTQSSSPKITLQFGLDLLTNKDGVENVTVGDDEVVLKKGVPYMLLTQYGNGNKGPIFDAVEGSADFAKLATPVPTEMVKMLKDGAYDVTTTYKGTDAESQKQYTYQFVGTFYQWSIPQNSYYLGMNKNTKVHQFFYKSTLTEKKLNWNPYSAIVTANWTTREIYVGNGNFEGNHWITYSNDNTHTPVSSEDSEFTTAGPAKVDRGMWEFFINNGNDDATTSIDKSEVRINMLTTGKVYNVNGQLVRNNGSLEGLAKGIYVINGKKYIVK